MNFISTITFRLALLIFLGFIILIAAAFGLQYASTKIALENRQFAQLKSEFEGLSALYEQRRIIAVRQALELRSISSLIK